MIRLAPGALWKEFAKTPKLIEARSRDHPQPIRKEYTVNQKRGHREKEADKAPKEEAKRTTKVRFAPGGNYPPKGKYPFIRGSHKAPSESLQNASAPKPASPAPKYTDRVRYHGKGCKGAIPSSASSASVTLPRVSVTTHGQLNPREKPPRPSACSGRRKSSASAKS